MWSIYKTYTLLFRRHFNVGDFRGRNYLHLRCFRAGNMTPIGKFRRRNHSQVLEVIDMQPNTGINRLLQEFPDPKTIFWKFVNEAYFMHKIQDVKPKISVEQFSDLQCRPFWRVSLAMKWPQEFKVEGIAARKNEAQTYAFSYACQKMREFKVLDENNKFVMSCTEEDNKDFIIPHPKADLNNIYIRIWAKHGKKEYLPRFNSSSLKGIVSEEQYWMSELQLLYPEEKVFEGYGCSIKEAEFVSASRALKWLHAKGIITKSRQLIEYSEKDRKRLFNFHTAPCSIAIPEELTAKMVSVLSEYEKLKTDNTDIPNTKEKSESELKDEITETWNVLTDQLYFEPTEEEIISRSREMFEKQVLSNENSEPHMQEIKLAQSSLPAAEKKNEILRLLEENRVVVVSGDTGCGKTTQVPQFILEHYVSQMKGATCNIVVTQPRRISAISVAERVASERNEEVGDTVGHHVRLDKNLPTKLGGILFCSTGMLLRKLTYNPNLEGVSHVIVDEVHERSISIDFLLILLRNILQTNENLKLLLMSASFNTSIFSQYFNSCPVVHISGCMYPVKEYYLEDLTSELNAEIALTKPILNSDLIANVINHIDANQGPGAVLCFLPGWNDILSVKEKLLKLTSNEKMVIYPAHSFLPTEEQKLIFKKPPDEVRKVILATNVAETSITINDVKYVVDSGLQKGTSFDIKREAASLSIQWVTKANVRQRRGRAGRVQPGICYHLFTREILMEMDDYPTPEIHKTPLESVVMNCKLRCPEQKAEDFLASALQPPSRESIQCGINQLQIAGVLDSEEKLTDLGNIIVKFAAHPRLSVALVYAAFLRCLNPVLTICAMLTVIKEPFINTVEDKYRMKEIKKIYDNGYCSDHLALHKIFDTWEALTDEASSAEFAEKNSLDNQSLVFIKQLKHLFAEDLYMCGIMASPNSYSNPTSKCNENSNHIPTVLAALSAAFYPNIIKVNQGLISHRKLNKEAVIYHLIKGHKAFIQRESVASSESELPSPWLVYFSGMQSEARQSLMASSVSSVPSTCLLFMAGNDITLDVPIGENADNNVILTVDGEKRMKFACTEREAKVILDWKDSLRDIFHNYLLAIKNPNLSEARALLHLYESKHLPVLKEVLSSPQIPFTVGQTYRFVNNELLSEDF